MTHTLGIDIGTFESKGVLVDRDGNVVAQATRPHEMIVPRAGWAEHTLERHRSSLRAYEGLCDAWSVDPAVLAIAWQLHRPAITAPVVGPRSVKQLHNTLTATDMQVPNELAASLEEIFPGYQTAPEAYAW